MEEKPVQVLHHLGPLVADRDRGRDVLMIQRTAETRFQRRHRFIIIPVYDGGGVT
jgi:hypothetical protein